MKFSIPDATLLINKKVKVILPKNRYFIGTLKSTDAFFNLNLMEATNENNENFKSAVIRGDAIRNIYVHK